MELNLQGGARAQHLNKIRALRTFSIDGYGTKVELHEVWSDTDSRLAWIVCNSGTWRLPDTLFPWAETVEEHAADSGYPDPLPCRARFEEKMGGVIEVVIFPRNPDG